jgi:hypothetical protein
MLAVAVGLIKQKFYGATSILFGIICSLIFLYIFMKKSPYLDTRTNALGMIVGFSLTLFFISAFLIEKEIFVMRTVFVFGLYSVFWAAPTYVGIAIFLKCHKSNQGIKKTEPKIRRKRSHYRKSIKSALIEEVKEEGTINPSVSFIRRNYTLRGDH